MVVNGINTLLERAKVIEYNILREIEKNTIDKNNINKEKLYNILNKHIKEFEDTLKNTRLDLYIKQAIKESYKPELLKQIHLKTDIDYKLLMDLTK